MSAKLAPTHRRTRKAAHVSLRLTEGEKWALLGISRRAGKPGNLSAAVRWAISQAAPARQPQGAER